MVTDFMKHPVLIPPKGHYDHVYVKDACLIGLHMGIMLLLRKVQIDMSLVMRKRVFGGLRLGKTQTGLLTYRD